ncbi:hypothetical protein [Aquimonas sp.]|uniref:hypothetical protein n=1 Tax=Aquimonas sp. TaxID=1872588 RepID=UPI0037C0EF1C
MFDAVGDRLRALAQDSGFPLSGRKKEPDSIAEKIESGRFSSWNSIDDLVGFAVIIPSLQFERRFLDALDTTFVVSEVKKRGSSQKDPEVFRFDSTRVIAFLRPSPIPADESDPVRIAEKIPFEVQIRTAFEHAWSVATHSLSYKPDRVSWANRRLASQMKAAVEQLDMLASAHEALSSHVEPSIWPRLDAEVLLSEHVSDLPPSAVPEHCKPTSPGRFAQNLIELIQKYKRPNPRDWTSEANKVVEAIGHELDRGGRCPPTLSAFQWYVGVLIKCGYLPLSSTPNHYFPVDESYESEFPDPGRRPKAFDWGLL